MAVADFLDALTHDRPYRKAWPLAKVIAEIEARRDTHFDPRIVDALLAHHRRGELGMPRSHRRPTPKQNVAV